MTGIGSVVSTICSEVADRWIGSLLGDTDAGSAALSEGVALGGSQGLEWLLAYCDDGVVWGRRDSPERAWQLSSSHAPDLCPVIGRANLQQLRLFGKGAEVLLWRSEGGFRGRRLEDGAPVTGPDRPADETRILVGNRWLKSYPGSFSRVRDADGREQAIPIACEAADFI
ncbi:MAG: hypothetical protein KDD11_23250, partial [Acidobacteria bacterium]|nr:hypothetical protein [Acidobacteriota bacterium]